MTNITHDVWSFIKKDAALKRDLERDLLNSRAVANYIIRGLNSDASVDAVISAIRRYPFSEDKVKRSESGLIFKNSKVSTKTQIALISMKRGPQVIESLHKVLDVVEITRGDVMRLSEGKSAVKLLIDHKNLEDVKGIVPNDQIIGIRENLCEINIHFGDGSSQTSGVIAPILNEVAANNINIIEAISCMPEYMIFVDRKDLLEAHSALLNFLER